MALAYNKGQGLNEDNDNSGDKPLFFVDGEPIEQHPDFIGMVHSTFELHGVQKEQFVQWLGAESKGKN